MSNTLPDLPAEEIEDDDGASAPIELKLDAGFCGMRLDKAVAQLTPQYSRSRLQQWFEAGLVLVDGKPARAKSVALGDEAVVIHPKALPEQQAYAAQEMPLALLHEDAALLVVDKPAGLVVHPAAGNWSGTLLNGLLHRFPELAGVPRAGIVHRLDKDTSGLMAVARTLEVQTDLVRQLQARSVRREYLALVWGSPRPAGRVEAAIARHPRDRLRMAVSSHPGAKPAVTHYTRLATGALAGQPVSLLRCSLETGRTHQIRVHMQSLGFPLVGDPLYGKPHLASVFPRQALHAQRLGLVHPLSGEEREWRSPLPADFSELLERAGIAAAAAE